MTRVNPCLPNSMKHHCYRRGLIRTLVFTGLAAASVVSLRADELLGRAVITRPTRGINHVLENTDSRINIEPNETVHLDLHLSVNRGVVRIEAPNGGIFNAGKRNVEVDTAKNGPAVSFDFSAGPNPGRYTIEVTHGHATRTFELWAGQEPPRGKPGPALSFTGNR
jgi:hypothetical protein